MRVSTFFAAVVIAAVTAVLGVSGAFASPVTVNFGSTGDNFMYAGVHGSTDYRERNWGTWEHVVVGPNTTGGAPPYRGLLHTDVSSLASIPSLSVQSAALTLTVSSVLKRGDLAAGESYDVELYLLDDANAGWWEGSGNDAVVPGASSWNYWAHNTTPWVGGTGIGTSAASPGLSALLGTATIHPNAADPNAMQIGDKVSFNITSPQGLAAVQSWATGGTNAGFFLKTNLDTGETNARQGAVYFGSKENAVADRRPVLSVDFTTPAIAHYRFEDATSADGAQAADFLGLNHGTYRSTVAQSSDTPAALPGSSQSISLNGGGHVDLTTLPGVGSALNEDGVKFDFWVKTDSTAKTRMFGTFNTGPDQTAVAMTANTDHWLSHVPGTTALFLRESGTTREVSAYFDASQVDIYDGEWHHVAWAINEPLTKGLSSSFDPSVFTLTVDGSPVALTYTPGKGLNAGDGFNEFANPFRIGAAGRETHFNERFFGQFDNFTISIIPEPGTGLLLMLAGLVGLCFRRRRR